MQNDDCVNKYTSSVVCLKDCILVLFVNLFFECIVQILDTAFKKETVGLVTREEYVEKVKEPIKHNRFFFLNLHCKTLMDLIMDILLVILVTFTIEG